MNQRQALQIVNSAVQHSQDRQVRGLNPHLVANLAEHFANISQYIDLSKYDVNDVLKMLIYADQQRQSGMQDYMRNRGRGTGEANTSAIDSNIRRIGNGTSISDASDVDIFAQYAKYQYQLGKQGPNAQEDTFVAEPEELKQLRASGNMPDGRLGAPRQDSGRIEGAHLNTGSARTATRKKPKFGADAEDVKPVESYRRKGKMIKESKNQRARRIVAESLQQVLREGGHLYADLGDGRIFTNSKDTWRGVEGSIYIDHGSWSDGEIIWDGVSINANDPEDYMWDDYKEYCRENGQPIDDQQFEGWVDEQGADYLEGVLDDCVACANGGY